MTTILEDYVETTTPVEKPVVKTICRDCIFSVKNTSDVQLGCIFDRLDKFKKHGGLIATEERYIPISEVVSNNIKRPREYSLEEFNSCNVLCRFEDGENVGVIAEPEAGESSWYYTIPRYCNRCRNKDWEENNKTDSFERLEQLVIKESQITVSFVIYLDKESKLPDLISCISSINKQTTKAKQVIVINNKSNLTTTDVVSALEKFDGEWHHTYIWDNKDEHSAIEEGFKKANGKFIAQIHLPCVLNQHVVFDIDYLINEECERFVLLKYKNNPNIVVASTRAAQLIDSQSIEHNQTLSLQERIEFLAKEKNQEFMIKEI